MRTRPSIVFPQNIVANSPTQVFHDSTGGKFGPFAGQTLVGEMNRARILRVVLEEVGGQLQGMTVPLLDDHGLRKGDNRFAFAPDGSLWVGETNHGWAGDKGIQRIVWTGKVPLDVKEMYLTKTGFDLVFTRPLETASASNPENYKAQRYFYEYHAAYGSKQFDLTEIAPKAVTVSEDRLKVTLEYDPLVAWRIYQFDLKGLKAEDGALLKNPLVTYTLNQLREGTSTPPPPGPGALSEADEKAAKTKETATKPAEKAKAGTPKPTVTKPASTPTAKASGTTAKPAEKKPPANATPAPSTKPAATPAAKKPAAKLPSRP